MACCLILGGSIYRAAAALEISGRVYEDANGNGIFEEKETPLREVVVSDGEIVTATDAEGNFALRTEAGKILFVSAPGTHHAQGNRFYRHVGEVLAVDFPLIKNEGGGGDAFTFVFASDTHVGFIRDARAGTEKAFTSIMSFRPDLVIHGGDIVLDALKTDQELAKNQYELYVNELAPMISAPLYHTLGNHDVFGWISLPKPKPAPALYGKKMYEKYFGPRYYSFNFNHCHFVVLDSIARGTLTSGEVSYYGFVERRQVEWLRKDLTHVDGDRPVILVTHIPTINALGSVFGLKGEIAVTPSGEKVAKHQVSNFPEVFEALEGHNFKLALAGHYHTYEKIHWKTNSHDALFVVGGSVSGEWWKGDREIGSASWPEGFTVIKVDGDVFDISFVPFGWKAENER
jgi:predicted MPP superfamily phosphohydrolase